MSWVIVRKDNGKAVFETFSKNLVDKINNEKYEAVPILEYLQNLNREIQEETERKEIKQELQK